MASSTVRVEGLKETVRAFNKLDRSVSKELQKELKTAAEPVVSSARSKVGRYAGASVSTIGARTRGASTYVAQRAKKVTGQRGDFGFKQQRKLEEALEENEEKVIEGVERALDRLTRSEGF